MARFVKERRIAFALDIARRKIQEDQESKDPLKDSDDETESAEEEYQNEKKVRATAEAISNSQFTIWTSMLKRSMETAASFDPDEYDIKVIIKKKEKKIVYSNADLFLIYSKSGF